MARLSMRFRAEPGFVTEALDAAERFLEANGAPEDLSPLVGIVLDEILTNILSYARSDAGTESVLVDLSLSPEALRLEIGDEGVPFDPLNAPQPDLEADLAERRIGGVGIVLVRGLMDEVAYRREGGRNLLTAIKRLA